MSVVREQAVSMRGRPLTLLGPELKPGDQAPDFRLVDMHLRKVNLSRTGDKVRIFSVVPSLDTPVCDLQTKRFNEEAQKLAPEVMIYTVSVDLPFAIDRWCAITGSRHIRCLSDYREMSFGDAYGTHIKELRLESRAIFVVNSENEILYAEYVPEMTDHPDYDAALAVARSEAGK